MKKFVVVALLLGTIMLLSCATNIHTIGKGAQHNEMMEARQWYILFGLVPLNQVDTAKMAGEAQNYTIKTEQSPLDVIMNIFTSYVSVTSRTVTVTK